LLPNLIRFGLSSPDPSGILEITNHLLLLALGNVAQLAISVRLIASGELLHHIENTV
jgi:hypothetical protein